MGQSILARAIAFCILLFPATGAYPTNPDEYTLKLVYLYNFTKFITWDDEPELDSNTPFQICVTGSLPSQDPLLVLETKQSKNRPISTRYSRAITDFDDCHILFITKSVSNSDAKKILLGTQGKTVVVGETDNFAEKYGDIGFVIDQQQRIRLEINVGHTKDKQFSIRAPLLEIASKIYRTEDQG